MTDAAAERTRVVTEALSWAGTPYHSCARIKAVGVDCAQFPAAVYEAAGLIDHIPVDPYSHQWHLNQSKEVYLDMVLKHAVEIQGPPSPGDFVLFKIGKCHAHGGIVIQWPVIIHAIAEGNAGVVKADVTRVPFSKSLLIHRQPKFFTLWAADDEGLV